MCKEDRRNKIEKKLNSWNENDEQIKKNYLTYTQTRAQKRFLNIYVLYSVQVNKARARHT